MIQSAKYAVHDIGVSFDNKNWSARTTTLRSIICILCSCGPITEADSCTANRVLCTRRMVPHRYRGDIIGSYCAVEISSSLLWERAGRNCFPRLLGCVEKSQTSAHPFFPPQRSSSTGNVGGVGVLFFLFFSLKGNDARASKQSCISARATNYNPRLTFRAYVGFKISNACAPL